MNEPCWHLHGVQCDNCRNLPNPPIQWYPTGPPTINYGWICQKCGASFAPFVSECRYCSPVQDTKDVQP